MVCWGRYRSYELRCFVLRGCSVSIRVCCPIIILWWPSGMAISRVRITMLVLGRSIGRWCSVVLSCRPYCNRRMLLCRVRLEIRMRSIIRLFRPRDRRFGHWRWGLVFLKRKTRGWSVWHSVGNWRVFKMKRVRGRALFRMKSLWKPLLNLRRGLQLHISRIIN